MVSNMVKLNNCIDCKVKLNNSNRSKHQPGIRCSKCFEIFSAGVVKTLEDMIVDTAEQTSKGGD